MVENRHPIHSAASAAGTVDDGRDHNHTPADDNTAAVDTADDYPADNAATDDDATAAEYDVQAEYDKSAGTGGDHTPADLRTVAHSADAGTVQSGTAAGSAADKRTRLDTSCRAGCNVGPSGEHSGTIAGVTVQSAGGHDDHP